MFEIITMTIQIHKHIDFSYRLKTWFQTSKIASRNLVPSPNMKNNLLSLSELQSWTLIR